MARRRLFSQRQSQAPRRLNDWFGGPATGTNGSIQTISVTGPVLWTTAIGFSIPQTLVRTRGSMLLTLKNATAQGDGFTGAIGIAKATTAAVVAGVGSVPTPLTEEDWDGWIWHRYFALSSQDPIDGGGITDRDLQNPVTASLRFDFDSKAMRKVLELETLYGVIEVTEVGTSTLALFANCRQLFKLH